MCEIKRKRAEEGREDCIWAALGKSLLFQHQGKSPCLSSSITDAHWNICELTLRSPSIQVDSLFLKMLSSVFIYLVILYSMWDLSSSVQFSSVQSLSHVRLFATP